MFTIENPPVDWAPFAIVLFVVLIFLTASLFLYFLHLITPPSYIKTRDVLGKVFAGLSLVAVALTIVSAAAASGATLRLYQEDKRDAAVLELEKLGYSDAAFISNGDLFVAFKDGVAMQGAAIEGSDGYWKVYDLGEK